MPLGLSGALLVWKEPLDALLNPARYAVTGAVQAPSVYVAKAADAAGAAAQAVALRYPESPGWPVTVSMRAPGGEGGPRLRPLTVYLDPPSARVLDVVEFRNSLFGVLHRFHENLTIPEYFGRAIVGWGGVALLISALTGLYLWWPRNVRWLSGLQWRRGTNGLSNLHHTIGFWICLPLAAVSLTGVYLGFPQQGRDALSALAPMSPPQRGGFAQPLLQPTRLNADQALDAAIKAMPGASAAAIFMPSQRDKAWRVELRGAAMDADGTLMVDDASGAVSRPGQRLAGDRIAAWIRWIHEDSHAGLFWRIVVFLCGLAPPVLGTTGVIIWLQRRSRNKARERQRFAAGFGPAE